MHVHGRDWVWGDRNIGFHTHVTHHVLTYLPSINTPDPVRISLLQRETPRRADAKDSCCCCPWGGCCCWPLVVVGRSVAVDGSGGRRGSPVCLCYGGVVCVGICQDRGRFVD